MSATKDARSGLERHRKDYTLTASLFAPNNVYDALFCHIVRRVQALTTVPSRPWEIYDVPPEYVCVPSNLRWTNYSRVTSSTVMNSSVISGSIGNL